MIPSTKSRTAFITGASSGIGEAYARRLASDGYNVVVCARNEAKLSKLARELTARYDVQATVLALDLCEPSQLAEAVSHIEAISTPDILVHSAGFGTRGHVADVELDKVRDMAFLHVVAGTALTRAALPGMLERNRGAIILVSSLAAFFTTAHYVTYSATKSYLNTFAIGLRDELAGSQVQIQAICPGLVRTGFMHTEEYRDFDYRNVPDWAWMSSEQVVAESFKKLGRKVVVIPGLFNRLFAGIMRAPLIGSLLQAVVGYASRKRIKAGEPALF
jgi:hypothetical protein